MFAEATLIRPSKIDVYHRSLRHKYQTPPPAFTLYLAGSVYSSSFNASICLLFTIKLHSPAAMKVSFALVTIVIATATDAATIKDYFHKHCKGGYKLFQNIPSNSCALSTSSTHDASPERRLFTIDAFK